MWHISIRFFGLLSERFGDSRTVQVTSGTRVRDLLSLIGLEDSTISLCIVNGSQVDVESPLCDGAQVMLIPVVAGG